MLVISEGKFCGGEIILLNLISVGPEFSFGKPPPVLFQGVGLSAGLMDAKAIIVQNMLTSSKRVGPAKILVGQHKK